MAMNAGTAETDGSGIGLAQEIFDAISTEMGVDGDTPESALTQLQQISQGVANAVVAHITMNARAIVDSGGLQRLPLSIVANEPTQAPSSEVQLNIE